MRPGVFTLMEDVVAVDGGGGQDFRQALVARYEASKEFRSMLQQLNWAWGSASLLVAIVTTVLVFVVENEDAAFALGAYAAISTKDSMLTVDRMGIALDMRWFRCCLDDLLESARTGT